MFFSYPDEIPAEIRKLKRGDEVRVGYEEKQGRRGSYRMLKSIELVDKRKGDDEERYARYGRYQIELLKECCEDAKAISSDEGDKLLAVAMFEKITDFLRHIVHQAINILNFNNSAWKSGRQGKLGASRLTQTSCLTFLTTTLSLRSKKPPA